MTEQQISFSEASNDSYEEYLAALDTMAVQLPEVAVRYGELYRKGLELVRGYQLLPSFFDSAGRGCLLVGLAGYGEESPDDQPPAANDFLAMQYQSINTDDAKFVKSIIGIVGRHHSAALQDARYEIDTAYQDAYGDVPPQKTQEILEAHTDHVRTQAIRNFIDTQHPFANQLGLPDTEKEQDLPVNVRVIGLSNNRESDLEGRKEILEAIGVKDAARLPAGWVVSRDTREICITEQVADAILNHPKGSPHIANDGINTLRHEKAHLERDWRLEGTEIGSAINEIGAEVLSGSLPPDWHYKNLLALLQEYNNSIEPIPADERDEPGDVAIAPEPPVYLEELLASTPPGDGFVHVMTGIARQVGLTGMVQMAAHMSGTGTYLKDSYHATIRAYVGRPEAPNHFLIPITDTYSQIQGTVYGGESGVGTVITSLHETLQRTDAVRAQTLEGSKNILQAISHLRAMGAVGVQDCLNEAICAYAATRGTALRLGKTMLTLHEYIRHIA